MQDRADDSTLEFNVSRRRAVKSVMALPLALLDGRDREHSALDEHKSTAAPGQITPITRAGQTFNAGQFLIDISQKELRVRHCGDRKRSLWQSAAGQPLIQAAIGDASFREHGDPLGSFEVKDTISSLHSFRSIDSVEVLDSAKVEVNGTLAGSQSDLRFRLAFHAVSENQLRFTARVRGESASPYNRIFLKYASSSDEAFFGFGQQLTYFNQKGNVIPILVQEHGIGRGLPIITQLVDRLYDGAGGTPYLTEAPAPHYITSQLRSLFLENYEYSVFDMRGSDYVSVKLFSGALAGRILFGRNPLELIKEYTAFSGRVRELPSWAHDGVIVATEGGSDTVDALLDKLLHAKVPLVGLWIQDWSGVKKTPAGQQVLWNWQLNSTQYPRWNDLVDKLALHNARVFTYINPFLVPTLCSSEDEQDCPSELYAEALSNGYLVKQNGTTFTYSNSSIRAGMIDFSNPEACTWTKQLIQREMIQNARSSGWMGDFGEALPVNAELFDGADPQVWHNHYPEAWARIQREAIEETGRGEDFLFWNRSGFSRSPRYSTAGWLGDQLQTWDEFDGIKTAVVGLLSGGISGFSILHSDTGGFVAAEIKGYPVIARSKELLMRWMELNAFTALFRTHEGLIPSISAQVDTDCKTLHHLAKFGLIYKCLGPYRRQLVEQASKCGYPVVRHLFLHFPDDPAVYTLRYQFMLGSDFLIAPVLDAGALTVRAYLPAGEWKHIWTGQNYAFDTGTWIQVAAPLGQPAVFFANGSSAGEEFLVSLREANLLT